MCFRNNGLHIQEKNGASSALPMSSSGSGSILIWKNVPPGITFPRRMHPCYEVTIVKKRLQEISVSVQATFVFL